MFIFNGEWYLFEGKSNIGYITFTCQSAKLLIYKPQNIAKINDKFE